MDALIQWVQISQDLPAAVRVGKNNLKLGDTLISLLKVAKADSLGIQSETIFREVRSETDSFLKALSKSGSVRSTAPLYCAYCNMNTHNTNGCREMLQAREVSRGILTQRQGNPNVPGFGEDFQPTPRSYKTGRGGTDAPITTPVSSIPERLVIHVEKEIVPNNEEPRFCFGKRTRLVDVGPSFRGIRKQQSGFGGDVVQDINHDSYWNMQHLIPFCQHIRSREGGSGKREVDGGQDQLVSQTFVGGSGIVGNNSTVPGKPYIPGKNHGLRHRFNPAMKYEEGEEVTQSLLAVADEDFELPLNVKPVPPINLDRLFLLLNDRCLARMKELMALLGTEPVSVLRETTQGLNRCLLSLEDVLLLSENGIIVPSLPTLCNLKCWKTQLSHNTQR
eukprot:gene6882-4912_t